MARHNILGKLGEDAACEYLIKCGYIIRERNWRMEHLEVDIIAEKNNTIILVEVKTSSIDSLSAASAINAKKQAHLLRAANAYIKYLKLPLNVQIDVICVSGDGPCNFKIDHIQDAIRPRIRMSRGHRIR